MKTFDNDQNGDLYLDSYGNIALVANEAAIAEVIRRMLMTLRGELLYARENGIPWLDSKSTLWLEIQIRRICLKVPEVRAIPRIIFQQEELTLFFTVVILTDKGEKNINGRIRLSDAIGSDCP